MVRVTAADRRTRLLLRSSQLIPGRRVAVVDGIADERVELRRLGRGRRGRRARQLDARIRFAPNLGLVLLDRLPRCPRYRRDITLVLHNRVRLVDPERRRDAACEKRGADRKPARSYSLGGQQVNVGDGRTKRMRALRKDSAVCLAEPGAYSSSNGGLFVRTAASMPAAKPEYRPIVP